MADYCKIITATQIMNMPNPVKLVIANPTDAQKAMVAQMDGWLEKVYTEPIYDPETQYVTEYWVLEDGKAVQHWEIHEKPVPEPTIEERVDSVDAQATYTAMETDTLLGEQS